MAYQVDVLLEAEGLVKGAQNHVGGGERRALEVDKVGRLELAKERRLAVAATHGARHYALGERLGAARLADHKERNAQLDAHDHHEDVLEERSIVGDVLRDAAAASRVGVGVGARLDLVHEDVLTLVDLVPVAVVLDERVQTLHSSRH